jgi:fermentation-respiration switch protein FrsA (DUF1100 family)
MNAAAQKVKENRQSGGPDLMPLPQVGHDSGGNNALMTATIRGFALAFFLLLGACTAEVTERGLLAPVKGGELSADAIAGAAPAYSPKPLEVTTQDGPRLYAVLLRRPDARATIIYFGGNGYTIGRFGPWTASVFAQLGVNLVLVDHRGFGQSQGVPSAAAIEADGLAVFDHVAALAEVRGRPILVHGQSLGSFIAGHVAARRPTAGAVLESSVTTTEDWARAATPGAAKPFVKIRIGEELRGKGNLANVKLIDEPLLLLVGAKDGTTPPALSQALYAASPLPSGRKTLEIVPGANHVDVMQHSDAIAAYRHFLEAVLR